LIDENNTIEFSEIDNWQSFENLVADYFREVKESKNISNVEVQQSGEGADGGRDILLTFQFSDSIASFERKWVVQCKFHKTAVSPARLSSINIPTLIHRYNADGYLLVSRNGVTSGVTSLFENLRRECKMRYEYRIWTGSDFAKGLYVINPRPLIQKYFPKFFAFIQSTDEGASTI
jgi:hypothetical protein